MAKLMRVPVSLIFWEHQVKQGAVTTVRCIEGLPEDAQLTSSYYDGSKQAAFLVFEHSSFREVQQGEIIPELWPVFEVVEN